MPRFFIRHGWTRSRQPSYNHKAMSSANNPVSLEEELRTQKRVWPNEHVDHNEVISGLLTFKTVR